MPVTPHMRVRITEMLGRAPRGLEGVAVARDDGEPVVIRVASLVNDKPFPTLFWLVDSDINYRIDQLEAAGLIHALQQRVDYSPELICAMRQDHSAHIHLRHTHMSAVVRARVRELGFTEVFANRGIGGIADFQRIRCLHTWYAAHLVVPNTVGTMLDAYWQAAGHDSPAQ